jgi:hypothetical protein
MSSKFNAAQVKKTPAGTAEVQKAQAISAVAKVDQGDDGDDNVEQHPGRYGQAIFRHAQAQARQNAQSRADNRRSGGPSRRTPPPGSSGEPEHVPSANNVDDGMASKAFCPVTSKGQHGNAGDDSEAQQHQRGRDGVFLAQARGRLGTEQKLEGTSAANAAADAVLFTPTAILATDGAQNTALRQFAQRAIAAINQAAAFPESFKAQRLLLAAALDVLQHNKALAQRQDPEQDAAGLSGVRQLLLEQLIGISQQNVRTQTSEDLNCLLPLMALNTERPRTSSQAHLAESKLWVMLRQQGG